MNDYNYEKFSEERFRVQETFRRFANLGINLDGGEFQLIFHWELNWEKDENINKKVKELSWNEMPSFEEKFALAMAIAQEELNNYLYAEDIDMVNKFFDVNITRQMIEKMGSRFI
jgi:hypothetical protein